jgi:uncharacterized protein (TIGR00251 family)
VAVELREGSGGVRLRVRVKPRSSRDGLAGEQEGALVVRLQAPPVEGAANEALVRVLARALGTPRSDVRIVRGDTARLKLVEIAGLPLAVVRERLGA